MFLLTWETPCTTVDNTLSLELEEPRCPTPNPDSSEDPVVKSDPVTTLLPCPACPPCTVNSLLNNSPVNTLNNSSLKESEVLDLLPLPLDSLLDLTDLSWLDKPTDLLLSRLELVLPPLLLELVLPSLDSPSLANLLVAPLLELLDLEDTSSTLVLGTPRSKSLDLD